MGELFPNQELDEAVAPLCVVCLEVGWPLRSLDRFLGEDDCGSAVSSIWQFYRPELLIVLSDLRSDGILPGSLSETHRCMQERLKLYESQCVLRAM